MPHVSRGFSPEFQYETTHTEETSTCRRPRPFLCVISFTSRQWLRPACHHPSVHQKEGVRNESLSVHIIIDNIFFQNSVCGKCGSNSRNGSKIMLGTGAWPGEIPWHVGLESRFWPDYADPMYHLLGPKFFCGGTLINANWVLTARHCTRG